MKNPSIAALVLLLAGTLQAAEVDDVDVGSIKPPKVSFQKADDGAKGAEYHIKVTRSKGEPKGLKADDPEASYDVKIYNSGAETTMPRRLYMLKGFMDRMGVKKPSELNGRRLSVGEKQSPYAIVDGTEGIPDTKKLWVFMVKEEDGKWTAKARVEKDNRTAVYEGSERAIKKIIAKLGAADAAEATGKTLTLDAGVDEPFYGYILK
jgi:hypothetical protein